MERREGGSAERMVGEEGKKRERGSAEKISQRERGRKRQWEGLRKR